MANDVEPFQKHLGCRVLLLQIAESLELASLALLADLKRETMPLAVTLRDSALVADRHQRQLKELIRSKLTFWSPPLHPKVKEHYFAVEDLLTRFGDFVRYLAEATSPAPHVSTQRWLRRLQLWRSANRPLADRQPGEVVKESLGRLGDIRSRTEKAQLESKRLLQCLLDGPNLESAEKPIVFIGSSTAGLPVAHAVKAGLSAKCHVNVWDDSSVFRMSETFLESLERALNEHHFAVLVFTPDDFTMIRGTQKVVARDNVVFELGLFIGKRGRSRAFIVHPDGMDAFPSDLDGLTKARFAHNLADPLKIDVARACDKLNIAIDKAWIDCP